MCVLFLQSSCRGLWLVAASGFFGELKFSPVIRVAQGLVSPRKESPTCLGGRCLIACGATSFWVHLERIKASSLAEGLDLEQYENSVENTCIATHHSSLYLISNQEGTKAPIAKRRCMRSAVWLLSKSSLQRRR